MRRDRRLAGRDQRHVKTVPPMSFGTTRGVMARNRVTVATRFVETSHMGIARCATRRCGYDRLNLPCFEFVLFGRRGAAIFLRV
jgi:hypothetical protein